MLAEMIFAGFGGQGVLSMGKNLAYAAIEDGKEVTGCLLTARNRGAVRQTAW